ncbi:MAG TPA: 30S ribosomal protein S13 [Nitrosopumilaceae archaeon]|nr:30S ribosomal protein S13 [Nitrosopumilaceae archaeon]
MTANEYQHIVRIVGNDIPGSKKIIVGLTQIRGIGYNFANAILDSLKINSNSNIGNLTESQVQSIEQIIKDPNSAKFPSWFLNRRKDSETGQTSHLITSDIALTVRNDIEREKGIYSWRGYRHMYGLKVRGQCTRTSGRKGGAVGVQKGGKVLPAGAPGAPGAEVAAEGAAPAESAAPAAGKGTTPAAGKTAAPAAGKSTAPAAGKAAAPAEGKEKAKETKGGAKK